jgi:uncharacterized protein
MKTEAAPSDRTRVHRLAQRAAYDRATIHAILDEAMICHVGLVHAEQPIVIPTIHWRVADELFIHGSAASRMLEHGGDGAPLCVTVSLVDGLVFARSAFHHSMNYRSVVILDGARQSLCPRSRRARALTERSGAQGNSRVGPADRRGLGQSAQRRTQRRRSGSRHSGLDGGRSSPARGAAAPSCRAAVAWASAAGVGLSFRCWMKPSRRSVLNSLGNDHVGRR